MTLNLSAIGNKYYHECSTCGDIFCERPRSLAGACPCWRLETNVVAKHDTITEQAERIAKLEAKNANLKETCEKLGRQLTRATNTTPDERLIAATESFFRSRKQYLKVIKAAEASIVAQRKKLKENETTMKALREQHAEATKPLRWRGATDVIPPHTVILCTDNNGRYWEFNNGSNDECVMFGGNKWLPLSEIPGLEVKP